MVNQYYFYWFDDDFGPFFIKFCSYFPFTASVHQRARVGQAAGRQGRMGFTPMDNASPPLTTRPRCRRSATG